MPLKKKIKSKQQTLHQKYKIQKKVKEAHRKARKEAAIGGAKRLKKDPGIPNLWPLKEQFIQKLQLQKAKRDEEQQRQKDKRKQLVNQKRNESQRASGMAGLVANASIASEEFEEKQKNKKEEEEYGSAPSHLQYKDGSRKAYFREFKKIVETADVILEVLDARDPLGCRCLDMEQKILSKDPNKKIILVLNKIDLIPKDNVEAWLKHLRNEYPTIAFKCSTQQQKKNLGHSGGNAKDAASHSLESSECLGADTLLQLLKNYTRNQNIKTSVVVGIIGYPNVGKSSLINSLKRSRSVGVGSTPGFTKAVQEIHLDKHIKLLDCPGIVMGGSNASDNDIILRNCVKVEQIPDPVEPVETILKRAKKSQLMEIYKLADYKNVQEFLIQIAQKRGKLIRGGGIDMIGTARSILQDWNAGKIPFFTVPPKEKRKVHLSSTIVSEWGKQFDIDSILLQEQAEINNLPSTHSNMMQMEAGTSEAMMEDLLEDEVEEKEEEVMTEDEMEDEMIPQIDSRKTKDFDDDDNVSVSTSSSTGRRKQKFLDPEEEAVNPQVNKNKKKNFKKSKKELKKGKSSDSYDFNEYFGEEEDEEGAEQMSDDDIKLDDI